MTNGNAAAGKKAILAAAIGNFIEYYDFSLYGFFATTIASQFFPKDDPTAGLLSTFAIFAVGFFIRPVGGVIFGHIGDRFGRRPVLVLAVALMSAGTVGMGLLPTYAEVGVLAPVLLLVCRLVQGLSASGEYTGATIFLIEHAPVRKRGRYGAVGSGATALSFGAAALLAAAMTSTTTPDQLASWGWRVPFLLAAPLAVAGLYLRMRVAESPVFDALRSKEDVESAPITQALRIAKKPIFVFIGWTAVNAVGLYLVVTFLVSYMTTTAQFSKTESLLLVLVAEFIVAVGGLLAGFAIDAIGRKPVAVTSAVCTGLFAIPTFMLLEHPTLLTAFVVVGLFVFFYSGIPATTALAIVELFPPNVRSSASTLAYAICYTLFGGTAPFLATWLVGKGYFLAPGYYLAVLSAIAATVAFIGIGNRAPTDHGHDDVPTNREQSNVAAPTKDSQEASA